MSCVFCDDPARAGDVVFEDAQTFVVLHEDWSVRGHVMIVAKRHVENASDLYADEWAHFTRIWQQTERVLLELTHADRAIALKLGIQTPHLHVHLYPVAATATREEVFAAIEGKTRAPRDEEFVAKLKRVLSPRA
ncbi:MAG TPA: HIT family protein [Thermoanaerobaculia bacterium]|nr:HIT family protein [Thermoanaerobaculia bacterium]